jgi:hypothetical protein
MSETLQLDFFLLKQQVPVVQQINLRPKLRRQICRRDWTQYSIGTFVPSSNVEVNSTLKHEVDR